jgi:hypothetical protein
MSLTRILALLALLMVIPSVAAQDTRAVSTINGQPIAREAFHQRVRFVRWQYLREIETLHAVTGGNLKLSNRVYTLVDSLQNPMSLGSDVLYEMELERLLWQTGERLSVTPSAEDAQIVEAQFFSAWTQVPVEELDGNADAQTFIADWYARAEAASGMKRDDIRILFETEALRARLFEAIADQVPREELAVDTRHILCSFHPENVGDPTPPTDTQRNAAETCIQAAQIRLASGEAFADVARALSHDMVSAQDGGRLGWSLLSYLVEPYASAAQEAELNAVVGPVETQFGLHLIQVLERRTQTLTDEEYLVSQQGYFRLWVDTLEDEATIERDDDWAADIPADPGIDQLDPAIVAAVNKLQEG